MKFFKNGKALILPRQRYTLCCGQSYTCEVVPTVPKEDNAEHISSPAEAQAGELDYAPFVNENRNHIDCGRVQPLRYHPQAGSCHPAAHVCLRRNLDVQCSDRAVPISEAEIASLKKAFKAEADAQASQKAKEDEGKTETVGLDVLLPVELSQTSSPGEFDTSQRAGACTTYGSCKAGGIFDGQDDLMGEPDEPYILFSRTLRKTFLLQLSMELR